MGILRNREELLPVTCAVLKENEREMFFNDVRRKAAGNMDRVAKAVGVPVSTLQDWVNGTANVPYITLQRLASEFEVEMPTVTELRREFQQIAPVQTLRPSARMPSNPGVIGSGPAIPQGVRRDAPVPRSDLRRDRPPRPERAPRPPRQARPERGPKRSQPKEARPPRPPKPQAQAPRPAGGPRVPKLSDKVAYWSGAVFAVGRRDGDAVVLSVDPRAGAAYAAVWAGLTYELFGVRAELPPPAADGLQEARLPVAGLEEFVNRLDLKPGTTRPPAPRWSWSNPDWKRAFLKGLVDASAELTDAPALFLPAFGDPLRRSVEKLLSGLAVPVAAAEGGTLAVEGPEAVEKYWTAVGSDNPKLREALEARFPNAAPPSPSAAPSAPASDAPASGAGEASPRPEGRGRKRRRGRGRGRRADAPKAAAAPGSAPADSVPPAGDHGTDQPAGHWTEQPAAPAPERRDDTPPEV